MIMNKKIRIIILKLTLIATGLLAIYFCAKGMYNDVFLCAVCSIIFGSIERKFTKEKNRN